LIIIYLTIRYCLSIIIRKNMGWVLLVKCEGVSKLHIWSLRVELTLYDHHTHHKQDDLAVF
jgi:hypothetical protein